MTPLRSHPLPPEPGPPTARDDIVGQVLYVDDQEMNRLLMQAFFTLRPRVRLSLATDGRSGIDAALRGGFQLVLLDLMLPDLPGAEVLHELRRHEATRDLPCVAVSAHAMPDDITATMAAGFSGYLTKPLVAGALLAEIDRHLLRG